MLHIRKGKELTKKLLGSLNRSPISTTRSRKGRSLEGMLGKAMEFEAGSLTKIIRKNLVEFPNLSKGLL